MFWEYSELQIYLYFISDTSINAEKVKLLCWILADPKFLLTKVIHQKATWGRRCEKLLVMSSQEDEDFPAIGLPYVQAGRSHIANKTKAAWKYIYKHYRDEFDFFIKTDPDTYLVVENLLDFLSDKDPSKPYFYGHIYTPENWNLTYMAGGPGLVLTKESLRLLIAEALVKHDDCWPDGQGTNIQTHLNGNRSKHPKLHLVFINTKAIFYTKQPVADPRFPLVGGGGNPIGGSPNLDVATFRKICMSKQKNWDIKLPFEKYSLATTEI